MSAIRSVAVVGLGLIGGSFEKAARRAGYEVFALHHGDTLPDFGGRGVRRETGDVNLILVCLPPEAIVPWVRDHASAFPPNTLVVDICGTKRAICSALANVPQNGWSFIGGHPMAGREVSGYANSSADLFVGASMILTPGDAAAAEAIESLKEFFRAVGFHETVVTTPEKHDDMIAFTSQLCHVIATSYARDPRVKDAVGFSAGSYANMTRIATQDAAVWSALYRENRDALVPVLDGFLARLTALRDAIDRDESEAVRQLIEEGTAAKREELLSRRRGDEMRQLVLATHNANKVREIAQILPDFSVSGEDSGAEETAETFVGNARLKARAVAARHPGAWVLADDSGLEVAALGGAPGVRSARYAGEDGNTPKNNALLLKNLANVEDRRAQFTCAMVLIGPDGTEHVAVGHCPGRILREAHGAGGFGYDPLFVPDGFEKTFAELAPEEKNAISHRGRALAGVRKAIG